MLKKWFNRRSTSDNQISKIAELEHEINNLRSVNKLAKKEIVEIERQNEVFIKQRDEYEQETKRLYQEHQAMEDIA